MTVDYTAQQLLVWWSAAVGAFLGAVYDVFRLLRALGLRSRFLVFLQDVAFCVVAAVSYILLIFNLSYGVIRFYAFAIIAAAFFLWHFTVGALFMRCVDGIKAALHAVYQRIKRIVSRFYGKITERRRERLNKKQADMQTKEGKAYDEKKRRKRHG